MEETWIARFGSVTSRKEFYLFSLLSVDWGYINRQVRLETIVYLVKRDGVGTVVRWVCPIRDRSKVSGHFAVLHKAMGKDIQA